MKMLAGIVMAAGFAGFASAQSVCTFSVDPDHLNFAADDASVKAVKVVASDANCSNVVADVISASWIHGIAGTLDNNVQTKGYQVDRNTGPTRSGTISIQGISVRVTQAGTGTTPGTSTPTISSAGIVSGASYSTGAISPGEILSIFGDNLGPATLAPYQLTSDKKSLLTLVSGTRVLFDGQESPILFTSKTQVSAIAPYAVFDGTTVDVQVDYNGSLSNVVTMPISTASPGIFSINASGKGQGAVLNQSGTVNSATAPAHPGEVLTIFGTGEGLSYPPLDDGELAPSVEPFSRPLLPVTASLGGKAATVTYAGSAPGLVTGLFQVNVSIPADVTTGAAVPILISVGSSTSPAGATAVIQPK